MALPDGLAPSGALVGTTAPAAPTPAGTTSLGTGVYTPGPDDVDAALLADKSTLTGQPAPPAPQGDLLLGKFRSVDDLTQAYQQLEARLVAQGAEKGQMRQELDEVRALIQQMQAGPQRPTPQMEQQALMERLRPAVQSYMQRFGMEEPDAWQQAYEDEMRFQSAVQAAVAPIQQRLGAQSVESRVAQHLTTQRITGVTPDEVTAYIRQQVQPDFFTYANEQVVGQLVETAADALLGRKVRTGAFAPSDPRVPLNTPPVGTVPLGTPPVAPTVSEDAKALMTALGLSAEKAEAAARRAQGGSR